MFKKNYKYYRQGFLDGITFTTEFLKHTDYEETLLFLEHTLKNLNYYAKRYNMSKKDLKKNTKVLIQNLKYFNS